MPTVNVYDPDDIEEWIRVLRSNPIRNRFRLSNERRFAVRVTGLEEIALDVMNVMECYLCGVLCMNRYPLVPKHIIFTSTKYSHITAYKKGANPKVCSFQYIINQSVYLVLEWCSSGDDMKNPGWDILGVFPIRSFD